MNKLLKKLVATLLLICLVSANLSTIGFYGVVQALSENEIISQNSKTQNANVEFNSYFEGELHSKTENISNTAKLLLNIKVKNAGYLENAVISFENVNFEISDKIQNEYIQSINLKENKIILNKINNGSDITIEVPVSMLASEQVAIDNFAKETITNFSAKYIDANGKQKQIAKQITNKLTWEGTAESTLETEFTKYVPYKVNEKYGVILQTKIKTGIEDSKLPVKSTEINIQVPEINGVKPSNVNVIASQTKATNGESNGLNFNSQNYQYDNTTGKIKVTVSNNQEQISWLKNVQDEYLVNLNFESKEIYDYVKANNINTTAKVDTKINVYGTENNLTQSKTVEIKADETKGTITDFTILSVQYINKGQIYANNVAKEQKETAYAVRYKAQVNNAELTEKLTFVQEIDKFISTNNSKSATTVAGNNYAYNKTIKINQKMFQKILGEDGNVEIYNNINNEKIGTINKDTQVTDENYVLDISKTNTNQITLITSKPILEGTIEIDVEKAIKGKIDYSKNQFQNFTKLSIQAKMTAENTSETKSIDVNFKEPVSSAELLINKTTLSTATKNNVVEIRAVLNTLNATSALYKNPTIEIELPTQIKKATIKDINLLLEEELKIKSYSVKNKNDKQVIVIELEGEQTKYFSAENIEQKNVIAKGANIIINTEIELDKVLKTKNETINMYYTNQNSTLFEQTDNKARKLRANNKMLKGLTTIGVDIVVPEEVTTVNEISNFTTTTTTVSNSETTTKEVRIPVATEKKETTIKGIITNNYQNIIENVFILGRIPSTQSKQFDSTESFGNTFDMIMKSKINVTANKNYKIYYSTKADATKDLINTENNWLENPTDLSQVKSYLIAIAGELEQGAQVSFSYNAEIPANLDYNNNGYLGYKVYFDNKTATATIGTTKTAGLIKLLTGESAQLTVNLTTNMDRKTTEVENSEGIVEDKETYYISNYLTSRFFATIKNTNTIVAKNVKAKINLPTETKVVLYDEALGSYEETTNIIEVGNIEPGETKNIEFELKVETTKNNSWDEKEIKIEVMADNTQATANSNKLNFVIDKSEFERLTNATNTFEKVIYSSGINIRYGIYIKPKNEMTNLKVHIPLPTGAEIKNAYWERDAKIEAKVTRTANEAIIELPKISNQEESYLNFEFILKDSVDQRYSTKIYVEADDVEKHYSNERFINVQKSLINGEQLKPEKIYVKEQETFKYKFKLTTTGGTQNDIVLEDSLPSNVMYIGGEAKVTSTNGLDYSNAVSIVNKDTEGKVYVKISALPGNSTVDITLNVIGKLEDNEKSGKQIVNIATLKSTQTQLTNLENVTNYIEYVPEYHLRPGGTDLPENPNNPDNPSYENTYKITGKAWIDINKNGEREESEKLLANVKVMLIYKNNSAIVKDIKSGENKITTTNDNGEYEFSNIKPDQYLVVFLYDAGKYNITEYQKDNVGESYNSDAIDMTVILDGKNTKAGVSDTITVSNGNVRDIDIGLYEAEKFDLKLDKYISKITLTTPTIGTRVTEYNKSKLEKVEVLKQNINKSSIVVEYKIVITNEGQVAGYAKKVVDYIPTDAKFNTEINKNWYKSDKNNTVFNASLAETEIKPGESKELTLVLSYSITDKNIGTIINNNAEIYESYNKLGLADIDSTPGNMLSQEDDMSKADIILTVATGRIVLNIGITLAVIAILVIGTYEIKKRVLKS